MKKQILQMRNWFANKKRMLALPMLFALIFMAAMPFVSSAQTVVNYPGTTAQGAVPWIANFAYPLNQLIYNAGNLYKVTSVTSGSWGYSGTVAPTHTTGAVASSAGSTVQGQAHTSSYATLTWVSAYATSGTWVCPSGVYSVQVEVWGAGGGGGSLNGWFTTTGGGAGGSYVKYTVPVVPGNTYYYTLGVGGTPGTLASATSANASVAGGFTYFGTVAAGSSTFSQLGSASSTLVLAAGGAGALASNDASTTGLSSSLYAYGGSANAAGSNSGDVPSSGTSGATVTAGGTGSTANIPASGTSSSHNTGSGGNGVAGTGTTAGVGGITFGTKGASQDGNGQGFSGTGVGAGGSGATCGNFNTGGSSTNGNFYYGGNGTNGQIVLTYTSSNPYAALPYTTSFTSTWATDVKSNSSNDLPDANWSNGFVSASTPASTINNYWHRSDYSGGDWSGSLGSSPYGASVPTGSNVGGATDSYSARFNNVGTTSGTQGFLDLVLNTSNTQSATTVLNFDYINPSGATVQVLLYTDGTGTSTPVTIATLNTAQATWVTKTYTITNANNSATSVIRFIATSNAGSTDIGIDNVSVVTTPTLAVSTSSLTCNNYTFVSGGPASTANTFNTSGAGLVGSTLTLVPSSGDDYEFSTSSSGPFSSSSSFTIPYTAPTLTSTPIYVRLKAGKSAATYTDTYTLTGGTATGKTISFTASVTTTPTISVASSLSVNSYTVGYGPATSASSFALSGDYLTGFPGYLSFSGATDYEFSVDNSTFYSATSFTSQNFSQVHFTSASLSSQTIYVRLKAGLAASSSSYNGETLTISGGGDAGETISLSGSVLTPTLSTSVSSVVAPYYDIQNTIPLTATTFITTATNYPASTPASVTITGNFQWSTNNSTWYTSGSGAQSIGTSFTNKTIYVKLLSSLAAGYYTGSLTISGLSSSSLSSQTVSLSGSVTSLNFVPGDIVALQAPSSKNTFATVIEVYPTLAGQTTPVNSVNADNTTNSGNKLVEQYSGTTNTMLLSNSNDGSLICFNGTIDAAANGYTQPTNTLTSRAVATLNNTINTTYPVTLYPYTGVSGQNYNTSTTLDNKNFYVGDGNGTYTTNGTTATGPYVTSNVLSAKAYGGITYVCTSSTVGTLASTTATSITALGGSPSFTSSGTIQDFALVSSQNNGTYDVLYTIGGTVLAKYTKSGSTWSLAGSAYTFSPAGISLCATLSGSNINLYTSSGTGSTTANSIYLLVDGTLNGSLNITSSTILYTAPTGDIVKGVALAPLIAQTINTVPTTATYGDATTSLSTTTINAGQTVTYTSSNTAVASINNTTGVLTIGTPGTTTITVSAAGTSTYAILSQSITLTVSPKTLTIASAAVTSKTYDGTTTATVTGTLSGVISADNGNVSLSTTTGAFANANVGTGKSVTYSPILTGSAASNYTLTSPTLTGTITAHTLTIEGISFATASYINSSTIPAVTIDNYGVLNGVLTADLSNVTLVTSGVTASYANAGPGTVAINISGYTITGSAAGNYSLTQPSGLSGAIDVRTVQTITFNNITAAYGQAPITLNATSTSGLTSFTYSSSNSAVASISGSTLTVVGQGTATITASQAGNSFYAPATKNVSITVGKGTLTITGLSVSPITYNGSTTAILFGTGTLVGVRGGDNVTLSGTPVGTYGNANAGTETVTVSGYSIGGTSASNYTLIQPTLSATINKANQTIANFTSLTDAVVGTPYTLLATSTTSGTNPITYTSSNTSVATVSGSTLTILSAGTTTITASQASSTNYNSVSVSLSLTAEQPTTLAAGDIAVVSLGMASSTDNFTVVLLKDIAKGTVINFTDYGLASPTTGGTHATTGDGFVTYTAPAAQCAGTLLYYTINTTNGSVSPGFDASYSGQASSFSLGASGDQLLIFQGKAGTASGVTTSITTNFQGLTTAQTDIAFGSNLTTCVNLLWATEAGTSATTFLPASPAGAYTAKGSYMPASSVLASTYVVDFTSTKSDVYFTSRTLNDTKAGIVTDLTTLSNFTQGTTTIIPEYYNYYTNSQFGVAPNSFATGVNTTCSNTNTTVTVTSTSLSNGTYAVTYNLSGVNVSTSNTSTMVFANGTGTFAIPAAKLATSGSETITITTIQESNSCSSPVTTGNTATFIVGTTGTWVGANGADANTASNWCGGLPNSSTNVVIASTTPTLSGNLTVANLTVISGANLNGNTLNVQGTTFINNGAITGTGFVAINTASTTISGTGTISGLTLNNDATITSGSVNLIGVLTVNSGTFNTGGLLTLKSTSITNSAVVDVVGGSITGNVTVERYIPKGFRAYRDIAPEVYNSGTIYKNWQENGASPAGYGTFITGGTAYPGVGNAGAIDGNGFDKTGAVSSTTQDYNFMNGTWTALSNTNSTNLDPFQGYRLLIRGDRTPNLYTTPVINTQDGLSMYNATTLRATGSLITGTVTYGVTGVSNIATGTDNSVTLNSTVNGFSLVANPYVCPVQWSNVYSTSGTSGINASYWYLDPTSSAVGRYLAYNALTGSSGNHVYYGTNGDTLYKSTASTGYIQAGQAVFVQSSSSTPQIVFTEASKATASAKAKVFGATAPLSKIYFSFLSSTGDWLDAAAVAFKNGFSNTVYGPQDALKFNNATDNLFISNKGKNLSIDGRLPATTSDVIVLAISKPTTTNYQLLVDATSYNGNGLSPYLVDSYKNTTTALSAGVNTIDFTADTTVAATYANRFSIVFKSGALPVNSIVASATLSNKIATITWNTVGEKNVASYIVEKSADAKTFTAIGQVTAKNTSSASYNTTDNSITATTYYRIKAVSTSGSVSYSNVAKVSTDNRLPSYSIYPNPLKGNTLNVSLDNVIAGKYVVSISNLLGQKVLTQTISHNGGSASHALTVNATLAAGVYNVIISEAGSKQVVSQTKLSVQP